jgi:EmrB/QacA subfamily drug resistance transporter
MEKTAKRWLVLTVAGAGLLAVFLDSAVNIAFPAISAAFGRGVSSIQWVVVCYMLTSASLLLTCGRLADLFGCQRALLIGLVGSAAAFGLCGVAGTFESFLASRVLQGAAAALVLASAPAVVSANFSPRELGRALGVLNMVGFVGFTSGPILGGLLVEHFGWRAVYLFRVPLSLGTIALAMLLPREEVPRSSDREFDFLGSVALAAGVGLAGVGLALAAVKGLHSSAWKSPQMLGLACGSAASFALLITMERRARYPLLDRRWLAAALVFANASNLLSNLAMFAVWLLVPYYVVNVLRFKVSAGGALLAPCSLGMALSAPFAGALSDRFGARWPQLLGLAVEMLGLLLASQLGLRSSFSTVAVPLLLVGLGLGTFAVANMRLVMTSIGRADQGIAAGVVGMMRTLGVVTGASSAAAVFGMRRKVYQAALTSASLTPQALADQSFISAFQDTFLVSTALCLVAVVLAAIPVRYRDVLAAEEPTEAENRTCPVQQP